jgi:hypothetical protein
LSCWIVKLRKIYSIKNINKSSQIKSGDQNNPMKKNWKKNEAQLKKSKKKEQSQVNLFDIAVWFNFYEHKKSLINQMCQLRLTHQLYKNKKKYKN